MGPLRRIFNQKGIVEPLGRVTHQVDDGRVAPLAASRQSDGGRKDLFGVLILAQDHIAHMERVTVIQKVVQRVSGNRSSTKSHDYSSFPGTRPTIGISIVRGIQPFCELGPSRTQVHTSHRLSGIVTPESSPILSLARSARAMSFIESALC